MKRIIAILLTCVALTVPVYGGEDYADGDKEQVFVWVQEGNSRFCYINNDSWSEAVMLTGWHTIDGETYYFYEQEMVDARYGEMAVGEVVIGAYTVFFDADGHLYDWKEGLE